jgi:hypothetical protein
MMSSAKPPSFRIEIGTQLGSRCVTSLGRGELRECVNRWIISAPAGVGQGNHRACSKWNLVEGVIAATLLRHVRAGSVADLMTRLRSMLMSRHIDPQMYCAAPDALDFFDFALLFPPRTEPDDNADPALGEDMGTGAFLIATSSAVKGGPSLTSDTPSAAFCKLPIDLEKAVLFVNYMIETKL